MTHITPAVYGLWAIASVLLSAFCGYHLWHYDRFRCLRWDNPRSGVFKRFMTYTYVLSLPPTVTFAVGNAAIKYKEGFIYLPGHGIIPRPYQLWAKEHVWSIFPLMMVMSFAWALEMITHLEELCFWLFLTNARSAQQDWFRSRFFYVWMIGSVFAITYMPVVTALGRDDPLKCEAWTFLAGSIGSLTLTILFIPVLYTFPNFLRDLEAQGVDQATVVRLTGFHELNRVRVVFRLMFAGAFVILGSDGVRPHHNVNESMFWTDFLAIIGAFGICISSALTLVIFFPRSAATEYMANRSKQMASTVTGQSMELREEPRQFVVSSQSSVYPTKVIAFASDDDEPPVYVHDLPFRTRDQYPRTRGLREGGWRNFNGVPSVYSPPPPHTRDCGSHPRTTTVEVPLRPNRRQDSEFGREDPSPTTQVVLPISANNKVKRAKSFGGNSTKSAKNWLKNVRSPIDMMQ